MSTTSENYTEVFTNIKYLMATALCFGIVGGVAILATDSDAESTGQIALNLFLATTATFSLVLFVLLKKKRDYWLNLLSSNPSEGAGLVLGMTVFGSLFAIMFYMEGIAGIPYLLQNPIPPDTATALRSVFNISNLLAMAFVTALASALSIFFLKAK
jgi:hypothetical protein